MVFHETPLTGCYVIEPERMQDQRGFFARVWCEREFEQRGLKSKMVQSNIGFSLR
jgi:dTDP-4-dehydrorhamnose 3,5-epimerase